MESSIKIRAKVQEKACKIIEVQVALRLVGAQVLLLKVGLIKHFYQIYLYYKKKSFDKSYDNCYNKYKDWLSG